MTTATITARRFALDDVAVQALQARLRGDLLRPGDDGYDAARAVWNATIDRRPALIARCAGAADVIAAVGFAREHDLPLAVKAGGHGVAGNAVCDDGLVIDLSPMRAVRVDPATKTARVEAGATWGDFDREAQAFGLATTGGTDSTTGVAGLTLGGGIGFLARTHGLAADNLVAADVVTADGKLVHASETENLDLFWALRGGGGNFGVVTSFEFRLHEVGPDVLVAQIFHPFEDAREVLRFYRDFIAGAPDAVGCYALGVNVPPVPPFPEAFHGKTAVALVACNSGALDEGKAALAPLEAFGRPILNSVQPMPYAVLQQSFDAGFPAGQRYYWKSQYLDGLPDEAIETLVHHGARLPGPFSAFGFEPMGGAINRVPATATAFPHRNAAFNFGIFAGWADPANDEEAIGWARAFHEAMTPYATGGVYVNYLDRGDDAQVSAAYGDNYERLRHVKAAYDPRNLFRMNQNIAPAS